MGAIQQLGYGSGYINGPAPKGHCYRIVWRKKGEPEQTVLCAEVKNTHGNFRLTKILPAGHSLRLRHHQVVDCQTIPLPDGYREETQGELALDDTRANFVCHTPGTVPNP